MESLFIPPDAEQLAFAAFYFAGNPRWRQRDRRCACPLHTEPPQHPLDGKELKQSLSFLVERRRVGNCASELSVGNCKEESL